MLDSQVLARRVCTNDPATGLVSDPRRLHRNIRNGAHQDVQAWAHGDYQDSYIGQPCFRANFHGPFSISGHRLSCLFMSISLLARQSSAKYRALQRAVQTHVSLTREAATGRGIDRHLLGLRLMLRPEDGERADLFDDELFQRSQEWKLSTSGLSAGHYFRGTG